MTVWHDGRTDPCGHAEWVSEWLRERFIGSYRLWFGRHRRYHGKRWVKP